MESTNTTYCQTGDVVSVATYDVREEWAIGISFQTEQYGPRSLVFMSEEQARDLARDLENELAGLEHDRTERDNQDEEVPA